MSLIQDALKRQQEEMNRKNASADAPAGSDPGVPEKTVPPTEPAPPPAIKPLAPLPVPALAPLKPLGHASQHPIPLRMMGQPITPPPPAAASPPSPPSATASAPIPPPVPIPPGKAAHEPGAPPRFIGPPETASKTEAHPAAARSAPAKAAAIPAQVPAAPAPIPIDAPDRENRKSTTVISVALFLLLLLGAAVYFAWPVLSGLLDIRHQAPVVSVRAPPPSIPAPEPAEPRVPIAVATNSSPDRATNVSLPLPPPSTTAVASVAASNAAVTVVMPPPALPRPALPDSGAAAIPPPAVAPTQIAAQAATPAAPPPPVAPVVAAEPVIWPPIKLTGFVKLGKTSAALINGKVISVGETIADVTLIAVTPEGARVRYKGEERTLRVGETAR